MNFKNILIVSLLNIINIYTSPTDLNTGNFSEFVAKSDHALIMFHAPWCGHCKNLSPEFEAASNEFSSDSIQFGKVDCTSNESTCSKLEIRGYPTVLFYKKGVKREYTGGRTKSDIISWIQTHLEHPIKEVKFVEECDALSGTKPSIVLQATETHPNSVHFERIADIERSSAVYCVVKSNLNQLRIKHPKEDIISIPLNDLTEEKLRDELVPDFNVINAETYMMYHEKNFALGWVYASGSDFDRLGKLYRPISRLYKGKIAFVLLDNKQFQSHAQGGLDLQGTHGFVIENKGERYMLPNDIDYDNMQVIKTFVEDFINGRLKKSIRSEPIPEQTEPVYKVVGQTFNEDIVNAKTDVLLKIYAHWCGHCKAMIPQYISVANQLKAEGKDVLVAEIDATKNDLPQQFEVKGFPTILYIPKDTKVPIKYDGARTHEDMISFVERNLTRIPKENSQLHDSEEL